MPDILRVYLNPEFSDSKRDAIERYYEDVLGSDFLNASRRIKQSILEKSGSLGMCGGLITSGWMSVERMSKKPIIIHIRSDQERPERKVKKVKEGSLFSGFAVLEFKEESTGTYLYLDGLCSNVGKAGKLMDFIINHLGKKLIELGLIQGLKLSALGYVIGYYYKKYGFKFYKKYKNKLIEDTLVNTALKDKFSKFVYNADDEYEVIDDFTGNWNTNLIQLLDDPEMKNMVPRSILKKLVQLNKELGALRRSKNGTSPINRRETLVKRLEKVREIQKIVNKQKQNIRDYIDRGFTPIFEFYLIAKEHSSENVHILTRGRSDSALARQMDEQGISNEGFYMYLLPEGRSVAKGIKKKRKKNKKKRTIRRNSKKGTNGKKRRRGRRTRRR
jgi:hypothetical protein